MTESEGIVSRVEGGYAWLEITDRPDGCGKCASSAACSSPERWQRVPNSVGARVGDRVMVGVADGALLRAVAVSYGLPLALMLLGAVVGGNSGSEGLAVVGAVSGLAAGWGGLRILDRCLLRREPLLTLRIKPVVVRLHKD